MNKLAQVEAMPLILGIVGAVIGWVVASRMNVGIIYKIIATVGCLVACYLIAYFMSQN